MTGVYGDPDKIREAANHISSYADFLDEEVHAIERAIGILSAHWQDQQFTEFQDHFQVTAMILKKFIESSRELRPVLLQDAERLEDMQKQ